MTVAPGTAFLISLILSSDRSSRATVRCPVMVPLKEVRGRSQRCGHRGPAAGAADGLGQYAGRGSHQPGHGHRLAEVGEDTAREQLGVARRTRVHAVLGGCLERRCVGLQAAQVGDRIGSRDAVDGAVVHLGEDRDLARLEALDDHELPERSRPVQRDPRHVTAQVGQLAVAAGRRQRHPVHVAVDVEVVVGDPHRVVDAERHLLELALEHRDVRDPCARPRP